MTVRPNFRSKLEQKLWGKLQHAKGRRRHPKIEFETEKLNYILIKRYVPDFIIKRKNGSKTYVEIKGYLRPADRTKMIAVKKFDPDIDLRIVFAQDNLINKNSKTRYTDWARKNGIPCAVGAVPKEWLDR